MLKTEEKRLLVTRPEAAASSPRETGARQLDLRLNLPIERLTSRLCGVISVLLLVSLVASVLNAWVPDVFGVGSLYVFTSLDEESNLPTLFSGGMLLLCGLLGSLIARVSVASGAIHSRRVYWSAISLILWLMAADEFLQIHERVGQFLGRNLEVEGVYAWVLLGIPLVALAGVAFFRFIVSLPRAVRTALLLSSLLYTGGAVGLEVLEAWNFLSTGERRGLRGILLTNGQEVLELLGIVVLLKALLLYIRDVLAYPRTQLAMLFGD